MPYSGSEAVTTILEKQLLQSFANEMLEDNYWYWKETDHPAWTWWGQSEPVVHEEVVAHCFGQEEQEP